MAPKPGGRHKQPGRLAFVSWATIRRIYDVARATLWALAVATVVNMIINIPQISEARRRAELQRVQEISEENRFFCAKWGLRANTHEHLICMMDLAPIIRGSWRLAMRAHDISRVDGGGCSGTLATRLEVGAGGESGTCRIAHGPQAAIEVASAVKA